MSEMVRLKLQRCYYRYTVALEPETDPNFLGHSNVHASGCKVKRRQPRREGCYRS